MNEIEITPDVPSRSKRAVIVSAVLGFALVLGLVVFLAGRSSPGGPGHTALVPLPAATASGASGAQPGASGSQAAAVMPGMFRPVSYQLQGTLPALTPQAKAYRLDGAVTEAQVVKLARALGLTTAVTAEPSGWSVTDPGHQLVVTKDHGGQWSYTSTAGSPCAGIAAVRGGPGGIVCSAGGSGQVTGSGQATTGAAAMPSPTAGSAQAAGGPAVPGGGRAPIMNCVPPPCAVGAMCAAICMPQQAPVAGLLSPQDALKRARDVLGRAGINLTGADVQVAGGPSADVVTVNPAVAGVPTMGMVTSLTLGANGAIDFAQGELAAPTQLGVYPLVGTKAGFERLQAGKWLFGGGPRPLGLAQGGASPATTGAARLAPGAPVPATGVPPLATQQPVKVTGVHLALVRVFARDSFSYLEPAYIFETAETWSIPPVPAVADSALQIAPTPMPTLPGKPIPQRPAIVPPAGVGATPPAAPAGRP